MNWPPRLPLANLPTRIEPLPPKRAGLLTRAMYRIAKRRYGQVPEPFAVAAHLEPEILVVDEVLAVGDSAFQAKCLGKMSQVASQGMRASGGRPCLPIRWTM